MSKQVESQKPAFVYDIILVILILLFCFSLFKNISYPLVWNDESDSVLTGERVLEYGYPKVHDGKNVVFMSYAANIKDKEGNLIGYKPSNDAYIYMTWGTYYWAAIGVYVAKFTSDIYMKTAFLRFPFTIMGFLGLILFALSARKLFLNIERYKIFLILFVFVELFSISLILHMREARWSSLVIFLGSCFFYIYSNYFLFKNLSSIRYYILMTLLLFFSYQTNFLVFAIFSAVLGVNRGVVMLMNVYNTHAKFKPEFISLLKASIPLIISVILIVPFLIFFETFKTSTAISGYCKPTFETYKLNFGSIVKFMTDLEFIYLLILIKIAWLIVWKYFPINGNSKSIKKNESIQLMQKFSFFATSFFILYILIIARIPYTIFVRYYIVLQPIMVLIMITDIFIIYQYIDQMQKKNIAVMKFACSILLLITFSANAKNKIPYIKDHIYEVTHQYKGVLDYLIPYIQQNYKNPEDLTIATNYEEYAYMYYLRSKVIVGYIFNNIEEDAKCVPDIIIYRKTWGTDPKVFNDFMQKAKYQKISFPVYDYPVNNIPELDFVIKHQFKTKFASNDQEKVDIFVRVK